MKNAPFFFEKCSLNLICLILLLFPSIGFLKILVEHRYIVYGGDGLISTGENLLSLNTNGLILA